MNIPSRAVKLKEKLNRAKATLETWRNRRLQVALVCALALVVLTFMRLPLGQAIAIVSFVVIFPPLVRITRRWEEYVSKLSALLQFYERAESRQRGKAAYLYEENKWPEEFEKNALHRDLNLFSRTGLMGLVDEFMTRDAALKMGRDLTEGLSSCEAIGVRQKNIETLSRYSGFLRRLQIEVHRRGTEPVRLATFQALVETEGLDAKAKLQLQIVCALWLLAAGLVVASSFVSLGSIAIYAWALFSLVSLVTLGLSFRLFALSLELESQADLSNLLRRLESFVSRIGAATTFPALAENNVSASLRRVERWSHFLSTQAHPIIHFGLNLLLPWSAVFSLLMESARKRLKRDWPGVMVEFIDLDLLAAVVQFYECQTKVFPQVHEKGDIAIEALLHPLLDRTQAIANDFVFPEGANQILITGSNMSGKSTFMRTIAINQVLALSGLPVFARSMTTTFSPVVSSIQVSDSLDEGLSSFYAEVVSLKKLHERTQKEDVLYFVDEIFRGTNNRERLIGSQSFLQALSATSSRGFVTTHDLELAELEGRLAGLRNYHFRDEIREGRMEFPYRIFSGPCPTTNALRIMKSEGLPVDYVLD